MSDTVSGTTLTVSGGDGFSTFFVVADSGGVPTGVSGNVLTTNGPMTSVRLSHGGGAFDLDGLTLVAHPSDLAGNNALRFTNSNGVSVDVTFTASGTAADVRALSDARLRGVTYVDITRQDGGFILIALDDVRLTVGGGASAPTVVTPTSASVTSSSATLGGNVDSDGGAAITERGVVYSVTSTNNNPLIGDTDVTKVTTTGTTGVFTVNASSLTASTGYSFKAYATNSVGTAYTSVATFTTSAAGDTTPPTLPAASIVVNNQADPHKVVLVFSEALNAATLGSAAGWTVTGNGGSPSYSIASVGLSSGNLVTLTLNAVDVTNTATYITNSAANAHLKVTPPATLSDAAGNTYTAGLVTEAGATHLLDVTAPTFAVPSINAVSSSGMTIGVAASEKSRGYWIVVPSGSTAPSAAQVIAGVSYTGAIVTAAGNGSLPASGMGLMTVTGLSASTTYGLYVVAMDAPGNVSIVAADTFTTAAPPVTAPTVTSPTSANVTALSATLGGNVSSDGGATISERGVVYAPTSTNANPTINGTGGVTKVTAAGTTGVFTVSASSLTAGTAYSYKAYAINSVGTSYSSVGTLTTLDYCSPNPCQNGGTCSNTPTTFICICAAGYSGSTCQISSNRLAFTTQPSGAVAGSAFTTQPVVEVQDGSGNTVSTSTIPITLSITSPGSATLSPAACTTVAAVAGVATFAGCKIDQPGSYTLTATAATAASATSAIFAVSCAPGYSPSSGSCVACPIGTYSATGTGCVPARPGYFVSIVGATAETACAANTFTAVSGSASCSSCPMGTASPIGSSSCTPITYAIATTSSPASGGSVSCSPNPVSHGGTSTCTAVAAPGYSFSAFSGDCTGTTCSLTNVQAAKNVTATFTLATYAITTAVSPASAGTVSCTPNPVNHGGSSACTATAAAGYVFSGFSGDCTGSSCSLDGVTAPKTVTAAFTCDTGYRLNADGFCERNPVVITLQITGTGAGSIGAPGFTSCSQAQCVLQGPFLSTLELKAAASEGSTFAGWEGECQPKLPDTCSLLPGAPVSITARFDSTPTQASRSNANTLNTAGSLSQRLDNGLGSDSDEEDDEEDNAAESSGPGGYGTGSESFTKSKLKKCHGKKKKYKKCKKKKRKSFEPGQFVQALYGALFDRHADSEGAAFWTSLLGSGISQAAVLSEFMRSPEFAGVLAQNGATLTGRAESDFVMSLYGTAFERMPDVSGFGHFIGRLRAAQCQGNAPTETASVAAAFFTSTEYLAMSKSDGEFVDDLYDALFGRLPDGGGRAFWIGRLAAGMSRDSVLGSFLGSSEFAAGGPSRVGREGCLQ